MIYERGIRNALFVVGLTFGLSGIAHAGVVFTDNFDFENGGAEALNYTGFSNWSVPAGTVDLIGNGGTFDFLPGNGLYVDLDGSTGVAGTLLSIALALDAGSYELSYELAGNQRNTGPETVLATVETGFSTNTISLAQNTGFTLFTDAFSLATASTVNIQFSHSGGDNIGMLLDDVTLAQVPEPATLALVGLALTGLGFGRRKKQ